MPMHCLPSRFATVPASSRFALGWALADQSQPARTSKMRKGLACSLTATLSVAALILVAMPRGGPDGLHFGPAGALAAPGGNGHGGGNGNGGGSGNSGGGFGNGN